MQWLQKAKITVAYSKYIRYDVILFRSQLTKHKQSSYFWDRTRTYIHTNTFARKNTHTYMHVKDVSRENQTKKSISKNRLKHYRQLTPIGQSEAVWLEVSRLDLKNLWLLSQTLFWKEWYDIPIKVFDT